MDVICSRDLYLTLPLDIWCLIWHQREHFIESSSKSKPLVCYSRQRRKWSLVKLGKDGDTVMVPIPDVDRGRATIGTSKDVFKGKYTQRNWYHRLLPSSPLDAPEKTTVDREESIGDGQGYSRCNWQTGCVSSSCSCLKAGKLCNSKCHDSLLCREQNCCRVNEFVSQTI